MDSEDASGGFEQLHELITSTKDVKGFLDGLAIFASAAMTKATNENIQCAVTLRRRKTRTTIAGSSQEAVTLDAIEQSLDDGPCVEAMRIGRPVLLTDVAVDQRWPAYSATLAAAGCASVLGVPLELDGDAAAVLNLFAPRPGVFTNSVISAAEVFADMARRTLEISVRLTQADQLAENLRAAMESRTSIDVACGIIMAQNRCTHDEAFEILRTASSHQNRKLHDIASDIVATVNRDRPLTHFDP
ncbi:ANTAR domain-containing protein [Paenarthrobacter sp. NPDC090522]|uniref:GAF and ANTAR domain-containing protein n=1 Tax=Paenarthrobacter sp. NPDC090522 TaxID=3364383 RepID=UPI0037F6BA3C